jgi:hypothetical protein
LLKLEFLQSQQKVSKIWNSGSRALVPKQLRWFAWMRGSININLLGVTLPRESITFKTGLDADVWNDVSAGSALQRDSSRFGLDS